MGDTEKRTELDIVKDQLKAAEDKLSKLANNIFMLHQKIGQVDTHGASTVMMADCLKLIEGSVIILSEGREKE